MSYNFYIQKYSGGSKEDIELNYYCIYKQFKDFAFDGEVKNVYKETYTEHDGDRMYIPAQDELTYSSYECKLQLLFKRSTCQADARRFYETFVGQKVEYYDNFRGKYVTLVMTKQPTISQEKLHYPTPYQLVEFTFTNVLGRAFDESQIPTQNG